jgi:hypothetical protein
MEKEITGKVQSRTENTLKIDNKFFKSFNVDLSDIKVDDNVKVNYKEVNKDNKIYRNISKVEKLTSEKTEILLPKLIDTSTQNTILLCVKDIIVKAIDADNIRTVSDLENYSKEATKVMIATYKAITTQKF